MAHKMPLSYVAQAIRNSLSSEIEKAVESALLESVMPRIRQIAADTAMEIMRNASTQMETNLVTRDLNLMVSFGGELFTKEKV